jgi:GTP cyclohydrolase I
MDRNDEPVRDAELIRQLVQAARGRVSEDQNEESLTTDITRVLRSEFKPQDVLKAVHINAVCDRLAILEKKWADLTTAEVSGTRAEPPLDGKLGKTG